jgi:agmatine deiminase
MKINYHSGAEKQPVKIITETPRELGYRFPAEFELHEATWLSWPHNSDTWPGKLAEILPVFARFAALVAEGELVNILVKDKEMAISAAELIQEVDGDLAHIHFYEIPTNDAWCRDHGPSFVVHPDASESKLIVNWGYNAWGEKYPPFDLDNEVPEKVASFKNVTMVDPHLIMEGGSVDFNGAGTVITTTSCLLNNNRNPQHTKEEIEQKLMDYYGVTNVLWLGDGIAGDDTDGHIDDITRFVNKNTVVTVTESNPDDENYWALLENLKELHLMKLETGKPLQVVELPMPKPVYYQGQRLPASYANFYICNKYVIVPIFNCETDQIALEILQALFDDRQVIGLDSEDLVWGLGSFHCLSQQEPKV